MYRRILIPLDGSPVAEQALPMAKMFVTQLQSSAVLFQAVEPINKKAREGTAASANEAIERSHRQARAYLESVQNDFPAGISVSCETGEGSPAAAILDFAERARMDLIAMATHGRTGLQRWVYGSVADKVLTGARVPILLVRAVEKPAPPNRIKQILVPLDGSELSEHALVPASQVAAAFGAEVLLVRVVELGTYAVDGMAIGVYTSAVEDAIRESVEGYLTQTARRLSLHGVHARWVAQSGLVTERLLETAHEHAADLVVMSTHGRTGLGHWIMGSVADRVLRASRIPVLLIRAGAAAR